MWNGVFIVCHGVGGAGKGGLAIHADLAARRKPCRKLSKVTLPRTLFDCSSGLCTESTVVPQNVYEYEIIRPIRFVEKSSVVCLDMEPKLPLPIGGSCVKHGGT